MCGTTYHQDSQEKKAYPDNPWRAKIVDTFGENRVFLEKER
jgi:hypothetical protein